MKQYIPLPLEECKQIPNPPAFLNTDGRKLWTSVGSWLLKQGRLQESDRPLLIALASSWDDYCLASREGDVQLKLKCHSAFIKNMEALGLTAKGSYKKKPPVEQPKGEDDDILDSFEGLNFAKAAR